MATDVDLIVLGAGPAGLAAVADALGDAGFDDLAWNAARRGFATHLIET